MERVKQRLAEERMHKAALYRSYQRTDQEVAQAAADYWWQRKLDDDAANKARMDADYSWFAHCGPGDPDWDERRRRSRRGTPVTYLARLVSSPSWRRTSRPRSSTGYESSRMI
jgi:hypothetical protein